MTEPLVVRAVREIAELRPAQILGPIEQWRKGLIAPNAMIELLDKALTQHEERIFERENAITPDPQPEPPGAA